MDAGFTARRLKIAGFQIEELMEHQVLHKRKPFLYTSVELLKAGYDAVKLRRAGIHVNAEKCLAAGYGAMEIKSAGFSGHDIEAAGCPWFVALQITLLSGDIVIRTKAEPTDRVELVWEKVQTAMSKLCSLVFENSLMHASKVLYTYGLQPGNAYVVNAIIHTPLRTQLQRQGAVRGKIFNGYDVANLLEAGISDHALKGLGYTVQQLQAAGFTCKRILAMGFTYTQIQAGFTAKELMECVEGLTLEEHSWVWFQGRLRKWTAEEFEG